MVTLIVIVYIVFGMVYVIGDALCDYEMNHKNISPETYWEWNVEDDWPFLIFRILVWPLNLLLDILVFTGKSISRSVRWFLMWVYDEDK